MPLRALQQYNHALKKVQNIVRLGMNPIMRFHFVVIFIKNTEAKAIILTAASAVNIRNTLL